jgi:hypothetical protein
VQRNVAEKIFLQAIGGWKKIRAQKNCPTPPPQISNGPSLILSRLSRTHAWSLSSCLFGIQCLLYMVNFLAYI